MLIRLLSLSVVIFSLASCGPRPVGYGVLYWANDESFYKNGEVVPVLKESKIRDSYLVAEKEGKSKMEIPTWSIRLFRDREEAESFSARYDELKYTYAYSERRALPVREAATQESRVVYKLKEFQVVKVLERGEERQEEGVYKNYWYLILTRDGYSGYCFGEFLKIFATQGDPQEQAREFQAQDSVLDHLMSQTWEPEYYRYMVEDGRYDLDKFREDIGLFPEPDSHRVRMVTDRDQFVFDYTAIDKYGSSIYVFEGTSLRIEVLDRDRISATYKPKDRLVASTYILLDQDVGDTVRAELERRKVLYEPFSNATLSSKSYGTIHLDGEGRFEWSEIEKLSSILSTSGLKGRGRVRFLYYPGDRLKGEFEGILTFIIENPGRNERMSFLYQFTGGGVQFTYVKEEAIRDLVVLDKPVPPPILFFEMR